MRGSFVSSSVLVLLFSLVLPLAASAAPSTRDLGAARPAKPEVAVTPPPPDPELLRQGGDTVFDAMMLPGYGVVGIDGTTTGYIHDYDEVCPYAGSTSPDVVYTFEPVEDGVVDVDLHGSSYDTKIYLYDENLVLIACNDDYYPDYTSRLEMVPVEPGVVYFLVIDGYGGESGDYVGQLSFGYVSCWTWCPDDAERENEPPLEDGYVDAWNGGCNSPESGNPFQPITQPVFCGRTGYYQGPGGVGSRDTDWFHVVIPAAGVLEIVGDADEESYLFELAPQDCGSVGVAQQATVCPYTGTLTVTGEPGSLVWIWFGPQTFWEGSTYEYGYVLVLNLEPVAAESRSWSSVKGLFD
jgi:hypothetical protein